MQPIITQDLNKPRKHQIFKWTVDKQTNLHYTAHLVQFLHALGFTEEDELACQLRHETLGYFLEGQLSIKKLQKQGISALSMLCHTQALGHITKYIRTENENGFGVFYAALGSRKSDQDQQVRFHVVDYDAGKQVEKFATLERACEWQQTWEGDPKFKSTQLHEPNANQKDYRVIGYYTQAHISTLKQAFLTKHAKDLTTALIVETYSGFHLYFRIREGTLKEFSTIQFALAKKFEGDTSITDHARILRLPYFFHVKDPDDPFFVEVKQWGLQRADESWVDYSQQDLIRLLDLSTSHHHKERTTLKSPVEGVEKQLARTTTLQPKKRVQAVFKGVDGSPTTELTFLEFMEQVKQLPIALFFDNYEFALNEGQSFHCLFHADENPSATIYTTTQGVQLYKCFSPTCCAQAWTVIDLVMHMFEIGIIDTINYLSGLVGVEIKQTQFQRDVLDMLHQNFNWIKRTIECKNVHMSEKPELYQFFTLSMKKLAKELMVQLLSYPIQERWSVEGSPVFFASAEYLAGECGLSRKIVQQNLDLLVLLGFFRKLPHDQVPNTLFKRYSTHQVVNYYTVGSFDELAAVAESRAAELKQLKFRKKEIGFDYIFAAFGSTVAQNVYPNQYQHQLTQPKRHMLHEVKGYTDLAFTKSLAIVKRNVQKKGYMKEEYLHKQLRVLFSQENVDMPKRKWDATIERTHMYLQTHGYTRTTLTKAVAAQLGLKQAQTKGKRIYIWLKSN